MIIYENSEKVSNCSVIQQKKKFLIPTLRVENNVHIITYFQLLPGATRDRLGTRCNPTQVKPVVTAYVIHAQSMPDMPAMHSTKKIDTESSSAPMLAKGITSQGTKNH